MPFNIGPGELILILIIGLVVLGPGKLPDVAQSLGRSVREFRKAATDISDAGKLDSPAATTAAASPAAPTAATPAAVTPAAVTPGAATPAVAPPPPPVPDAPPATARDGASPAGDPNPS